jgi:hypothetical protein
VGKEARIPVSEILPSYIESRLRQQPPPGVPIVPGSTPVIAFGDARKARVATLGWNPSKQEFLAADGREIVGKQRRLETLASVKEIDLARSSEQSVASVFDACNNYFHRNPYRWFNSLEKVLKHTGASYYDGSACHLDLVQWATNPVWGKLSQAQQQALLNTDVPFLKQQLSQENIEILLLNGKGIVDASRDLLQLRLAESTIAGHPRLRLFSGRGIRGPFVIGWNINLQSSFGVSNAEINAVGIAVRQACGTPDGNDNEERRSAPKRSWHFWKR